MGRAAGFIVRLSLDREEIFEESYEEGIFAEPVSEFSHSRNIPLLCFILDSSDKITHIALGKRGRLAGTDLRRLNLEQIFKLKEDVPTSSIYERSPSKVRKNFRKN